MQIPRPLLTPTLRQQLPRRPLFQCLRITPSRQSYTSILLQRRHLSQAYASHLSDSLGSTSIHQVNPAIMSDNGTLHVGVVGLGAIGTFYGWILDRSDTVKVHAVCGSNYASVKEHGVKIESAKYGSPPDAWKPYRVLKNSEEAADRDYDFVVVCSKAIPDKQTTPSILGSLLTKTKTFVLIQNGIGIERDLQQAAPTATVISGCAWIDCTLVDNSRTLRHGKTDKLIIGAHNPIQDSEESKRQGQTELQKVIDALQKGGTTPIASKNIIADRWRKNLWNSAFSTLSTLSRADLFQICAKNAWAVNHPTVEGIMDEVVSVARAIGITEDSLPSSAIQETITNAYSQYDDPSKGKPFKPSMLVDLEAGRPMEVEGIVGSVVRQAKEVGVDVPRMETAYAALRLLQQPLLNAKRP